MRKFLFIGVVAFLIGVIGYPYLFATPSNPPGPTTITGMALTQAAKPGFRQIRGTDDFWRLAEDTTGVWWFVSPEGRLQFLNTVTTVQPEQDGREANYVHYASLNWDGRFRDPDIDAWAINTLKRVRDFGFKGLGAWCNPAFHRLDVPMSQDLNLWAWDDDPSKRFYSPDWLPAAQQAVKNQVVPLKNNRNLVGYYLDNELDWGDGFSGPGAYFDNLPNSDPNRQQVLGVIQSVWPSLGDFNSAWDAKITDWSQLTTWPRLPIERSRAYDRLSTAWLYHLAKDYFRVTTALVRKADPNHLILGVRFKGIAPEEVVAASRNYTDAQSLNYYVSDARLDPDMFRMMYQSSGQPIVISEYSFHAMDGRSGNLDSVGFSAQVPDQQARADGYRLMTSRLARVPYIVGCDWFQWCDEPPQGRSSDGEDVDFGVVDVHDHPYDMLVNAIRQTTPTLNPLHSQSATDPEVDVWRESYAVKPVMHVPFLIKPPVLDGDLSQWCADSRLQGVRREQTVGLDRCKIQTPLAYLGWTRNGLYIACEVFDSHIETAPADAWWWTRDSVEFFLSTRPVPTDQISYDVYCHQFFVDPEDPTANNVAVIGQWHRDGDGLKDNVIPDPNIQKSVRILPDRYVVEMFIPSKSLRGYDPIHDPALAFNMHVRDFAYAADFFWSAPKSSRTELRPNTWGSLYLDAPTNAATAPVAKIAQARAD